MNKIIIQLTTFCGQCVEAIHYYASVAYYDSNNDYCNEKIKRPITQKEIESDKDRFYAYEVGDLIECFLSWKQAVEAAKEYIESNNLDGIVYVDGVPNNGRMVLEQALSPKLDTRKKCSKCGKVFAPGEGLYNFPSGALCVKCRKSKK